MSHLQNFYNFSFMPNWLFQRSKPYLYLLTILLSLRWMHCEAMNETFGSCRPWTHDNQTDNLNILSNFKQNLRSYEKVYKKFCLKIRPQLPQIQSHRIFKSRNADGYSKQISDKTKTKTLQSNSILSQTKERLKNKSIDLHQSNSVLKVPKKVENHKRGQTSMQMMNKQNNQIKQQKCILTERLHYNPYKLCKADMKNNVYQISFSERYKYRMLRKKQLHQMIFGPKQNTRKKPSTILR